MMIKKMFEAPQQERPVSPSLSYDSGSGEEEGPQLGLGVKTHTQRVTEAVSVNYPIQCQVRAALQWMLISKLVIDISACPGYHRAG